MPSEISLVEWKKHDSSYDVPKKIAEHEQPPQVGLRFAAMIDLSYFTTFQRRIILTRRAISHTTFGSTSPVPATEYIQKDETVLRLRENVGRSRQRKGRWSEVRLTRKGGAKMKWIFFAYGLFALATILRFLPGLGRFGLSLRFGNAEYGMSFNQIAYYLLLAVGSIVILAQVIGDIIKMIAAAHAHK